MVSNPGLEFVHVSEGLSVFCAHGVDPEFALLDDFLGGEFLVFVLVAHVEQVVRLLHRVVGVLRVNLESEVVIIYVYIQNLESGIRNTNILEERKMVHPLPRVGGNVKSYMLAI